MFLKVFGWSLGVSVVGFALGFLYGGATGLAVVAILAILEVSLSFDNAVVNATILARLRVFWQTIFLTVGIAIAVFGMRLLFPLLLVSVTAGLMPVEAIQLAMEKGDPDTPGTYGYLLHEAHPSIAAFGGMFLLMLFLDFILEQREITWLSWLERPLARIGRLNHLPVVIALITLCVAASQLAPEDKVTTVLFSGALGLVTYMLVNGLGELFESGEPPVDNDGADIEERADKKDVVGAVAITSDPIIIALGLGVGAMFIRSFTVLLVRKGTLNEYVYLEHGAMWVIGALAIMLMLTMRFEIPEVVIGVIGVGFIGLAFATSIMRNRKAAAPGETPSKLGSGTRSTRQ